MKLSEIAKLVNGNIVYPVGAADNGGVERDLEITGVGSLRDASSGDISFLANKKYSNQLDQTKASAVLVSGEVAGEYANTILVRVASPDKAFATIVPFFTPPQVIHPVGVHPTAVVGENVKIGVGTSIGPYVVIGKNCVIGENCIIEAHVVLGESCVLANFVHLYSMVSVRERCRIGNRVIVHNGTVIGSDGYGYTTELTPDGNIKIEKVPQMGIVELCDDVEVGANTTVDRARFGVTRIGRLTKIDNLVQVAHNVEIGECTGVAAQVGISGSTKIGSRTMLWGQVGLAGHLDIGDDVEIMAQSGVSRNIQKGAKVFGSPAVDRMEALRNMHTPKVVEKLQKEISVLREQINKLISEKSTENK